MASQTAAVLGESIRAVAGGAVSDRELLRRFAGSGDQGAFAALFRRHAGMVLGVCRRALPSVPDAEDACQATFLLLSRKAGSGRWQPSVANWLYLTARRVARNARVVARRRARHEGRAAVPEAVPPVDRMTGRELLAALDEELGRLPPPYREPLVLCYLEGLTRDEAALRLGLPPATLKSRLERGRKRLGDALTKRGCVAGAGLLALAATSPADASPPRLAESVLATAAGQVPVAVAALARDVAVNGAAKKSVAVWLVLAGTAALGLGLVAAGFRAAGPPPGQAAAAPRPQGPPPAAAMPAPGAKAADEPRPAVGGTAVGTVSGRVLAPDGNPVHGAKLLFLDSWKKVPAKVWATSAADGQFHFTVPKAPVDDSRWASPREHAYVMAAAEGYGFAVAPLVTAEASALTLRLVNDDVPIRGRVLSLEGKPIAGVRVRVNDLEPLNAAQLYVPDQGDLTAWLAALKTNPEDLWDLERTCFTGLRSPAFGLLFPPVTTGPDGRFQVRGIGRERLAHLRLEGPTIATQIVSVMTRPGEKIRLPVNRRLPKGQTITYHGAALEVLAVPTKPVSGVVRDRDTGRPLAGVTVEPGKIANPFGISNYDQGLVSTTTDEQGRYRLVGLPKGEDNRLLAVAYDLPYLPASKTVDNTRGLEPVTVDFTLKRGVWVTGRVTESGTGKPLSGGVGYYCFSDNPHREEIALAFGCPSLGVSTREDGSYRVVAAPGRGLIAVQVANNYRYLPGVGAERIKGRRVRMGGMEGFDTYPFMCQTWNHNALVAIDPKPGDESVTCDLTVVPGRALKGTVVGPDGKPLAGARQGRRDTLPGSDFTLWGLPANELREPRVIEFVHEGRKLAGFVTVRGDERGPVQVGLRPWGTLVGRLVTPKGEPLPGARVSCDAGHAYPGKDGRFRIEGLTPGIKYELWVDKDGRNLDVAGGHPKDLKLEAGETMDLGDLIVKPRGDGTDP